MKTELRKVSPEVAKEMLKRNANNRNLSPSHVKFLAKEMNNEEWVFDGSPIIFSNGGTLLNGQHRLNAIIESGTTQEFLVVTGIKKEAFKVMDTGRGRRATDALYISGIENPQHTASAVQFILSFEETGAIGDGGTGSKKSNFEITEWVKSHSNITSLVKEGIELSKSFSKVISPGRIAGIRYILSKRSVTDSEFFMNKLCNGLDLSKESPIYVLRKKLIDDKLSETKKMTRKKKLAIIIKAWNLFRKGESCKDLRFGNNEKFPKIM